MPGRAFAPHLTSGFRLTLVPGLVVLTLLTACSASDAPTAPSTSPVIPVKAAAAISDASQGAGNSHFYWLPPVAPSATYGGTFDPGLQPTIRICRVASLPCAVPLVTIPTGNITVDVAAKSYSAKWSTSPANITVEDYRAEVWIANRKMGFADVRVVAKQRDMRDVPTGFVGVVRGNTLTLAFRLEFGIVASINIAPLNPAIDSGTTVQLSATAVDFHSQVIPNTVFTWTSGSPSIASVNSAGLVSGVAPGTALVTASANGGAFAADTITVKRPIADWSAAVEWTMYQGNASHTGYNPVAMDVRVFQELWSRNVSTAALNPVTAGDGKVFVSTNAYFGIQQAKSLDARTGNELWSRDFGGIHSVNPPAYGNGTVYLQTGGHEDSFLWAIDAATGSVRFRNAYGNQWSRFYAPVVVGTSVYIAGGYYGGMYGFNTDATQRWFTALNQYDQFVPAVKGGFVYAYTGSYQPKLTVADTATGTIAYEIADPGFVWDGWSMNAAPTLGNVSNVLATNGGRLISFNLQSRSIGYAVQSNFRGQVSVANGTVYVSNNGQVEARNESDGSLQWLWIPPEGQPSGPMIVTKNILLVSTAAKTYAVDLATRQPVWSYPAGGHLTLSAQGILFIAQSSGRLTAISAR
jgi:hypothetical protein